MPATKFTSININFDGFGYLEYFSKAVTRKMFFLIFVFKQDTDNSAASFN